MTYGIFKLGKRYRTRSGAHFDTPSQAWRAVKLAMVEHSCAFATFTPQDFKRIGITVKRLPLRPAVQSQSEDHAWYVTGGHLGGIVYAQNAVDAALAMEADLGRANGPYRAHLATEEDISWVVAMSGKIKQ